LITAFSLRQPLLLAVSLLALAGASASAVPLARVEGVEDPELNAALAAIVGEAPSQTDNRWRSRERARDAGEQIRRYLDSQGYFAALIDPRLDDEQRPLVRVRPGERFTIDALELVFDVPEGSRQPGDDIRAAASLRTGQAMRSQDILNAEAAIVQALRNNGWPQASASDHVIVADHLRSGTNVELRFETGPYLRFGEPQLAGGLADLREDYVASLAPFAPGDPASARLLNTYTQRLQALDSVALAETRLAPAEEGEEVMNQTLPGPKLMAWPVIPRTNSVQRKAPESPAPALNLHTNVTKGAC